MLLSAVEAPMTVIAWIRDRALTLVLMAMFLLSLVGQVFTGLAEYNHKLRQRWSPESKPVHAPHAETR